MIERVDRTDERSSSALTKEQIKNAPEFDEVTYRDDDTARRWATTTRPTLKQNTVREYGATVSLRGTERTPKKYPAERMGMGNRPDDQVNSDCRHANISPPGSGTPPSVR